MPRLAALIALTVAMFSTATARCEDKPPAESNAAGKVSATRLEIERALLRPTTLKANAMTFRAAIVGLAAQTAAPIVVDPSGLRLAGVDMDREIAVSIIEVPLRDALDRILKPLRLVYIVKDDVLLVTDESIAPENQLITKVYPMEDLLASDRRIGKADPHKPDANGDEKHLSENPGNLWFGKALVRSCPRESWEAFGGRGRMATFGGHSKLLVTQTRQNHDCIAVALRVLRDVKSSRPTAN